MKISALNKYEIVNAEKLAKDYGLKSKNSVYTINKNVKNYATHAIENLGSYYNPFESDESDCDDNFDEEFENKFYSPLENKVLRLDDYREREEIGSVLENLGYA